MQVIQPKSFGSWKLLFLCIDPKDLSWQHLARPTPRPMQWLWRCGHQETQVNDNQQIKVDLYAIPKREILSEPFPKDKCGGVPKKYQKLSMPSAKFMSFWSAPVWKNTQFVPRWTNVHESTAGKYVVDTS